MATQVLLATLAAAQHPSLPRLEPAEPLWKRAPTHGDDGRPLSDFMMIIPGLREKDRTDLMSVVDKVERVLNYYRSAVVFADLNLRLNVLWVTVRPIPRISLDIASAIHFLVPEARLVAQKYPFW